ncbi:TetR/AcrR family transcriptional regulator [Corynebacterium mendelii]|uniref:TetR/AcrR family transcriptional regulator n=1 Tax=Corynebacterium mendelii TaxID=2765362 RepID=A0A939E1M5_9CORY|nr:TetR/AcrR family transcriptional regulator [Corynebacterium mendelii]MBN9643817.1 TetR/AcrR family transcriptional regulator [Corynebacterium mendelii]
MTRRRLSKEERRSQIQRAAADIILEKGYEATTMDDVIEKTGMSTGGVYHYYKNVHDIFFDIMSEGLDYAEHRSFGNEPKNAGTFINYQMEKIYDDNEYKELFSILLQGLGRNAELRAMYQKLNRKYGSIVHSGLGGSGIAPELLEDRFLVFFVHSLMLGYQAFAPLGAKEEFNDNKDIVEKMLTVYVEEKLREKGEKQP